MEQLGFFVDDKRRAALSGEGDPAEAKIGRGEREGFGGKRRRWPQHGGMP